jgi:virulence-associated protein VagC
LPKEYRFESDTVLIRREGHKVILEPSNAWPVGYAESFQGVGEDFKRPRQGKTEKREPIA